jgi:homoserine/homoserine lactone efflux protein
MADIAHQSLITNHQSPFASHALMNTWLNFALVALVVSLVPGPAFIVVLTTALRRGFKPGAYATAGIVIGDAVYFSLTAVGLGSLLATSFWTFTIIKWLGIAYLVYLGLRSLFFPSNSLIAADGGSVSGRSQFITALTVQLANPKLLLFLAALVPQFLDPTRPVAPQLAVLGPIFMLSDTIIYLLLSMLAARARPLLASRRATRIVSRVSGVAMLGAAAQVATK